MATLLVLAIGKRWLPSTSTVRPVERSTAATPMRPCEASATPARRRSKSFENVRGARCSVPNTESKDSWNSSMLPAWAGASETAPAATSVATFKKRCVPARHRATSLSAPIMQNYPSFLSVPQELIRIRQNARATRRTAWSMRAIAGTGMILSVLRWIRIRLGRIASLPRALPGIVKRAANEKGRRDRSLRPQFASVTWSA